MNRFIRFIMEQERPRRPRTIEAFEAILRFKQENDGLFPTIRELADLMGITTTSGVDYHLRTLVELDLLERRQATGNRRAMPYIVPGGRWISPLEGGKDE